ncbi:MAG: hypothetical protein H0W72_09750 [Planctomycetes bacterium]|nr:hypothetical protein [Planctomycetota bacterium]
MLIYEVVPPKRRPRHETAFHCLVLHGLGDSMAGWMPAAPLFDLPELGWVFANAPDEYYGGYSWFELGERMYPDAAGVHRSRAELEETIDHLLGELAIPSERLFVLGFSQGCLMALELALRGPRVFAGVVAISGWVHGIEDYPAQFGAAAPEQHVLMTHGLLDPMLPIDVVRPQAAALKQLGLDLEWREYRKDHGLDPAMEVGDVRRWLNQRMAGALPKPDPLAT